MDNKKGQGLSINAVIILILILVVLIVIIVLFSDHMQKFSSGIEDCRGRCVNYCEGEEIKGNCNDEKVCCVGKEGDGTGVYTGPSYPGGSGVTPTLINRYLKFKDLFEKYTNINSPAGLSGDNFQALLVAVAQKESSLGYPGGLSYNPTWLMGYDAGGQKPAGWGGAEQQVKMASVTLKGAIDSQNNNYKACNNKQGDDKIKCILSVYNSGKAYGFSWGIPPSSNPQGTKYADQTFLFWQDWKKAIKDGVSDPDPGEEAKCTPESCSFTLGADPCCDTIPYCGDGVCDKKVGVWEENFMECSKDCKDCDFDCSMGSYPCCCGNGHCDPGEASSCPEDCTSEI